MRHQPLDVPFYDQLLAAGIWFPRGRGDEALLWDATHPALPPGFESGTDCETEDIKRLMLCRALNTAESRVIAAALGFLRGHWPEPTLASARYYRYARVRFLVGALAILRLRSPGPLYFATVIAPKAFVPAGTLCPVLHPAILFKNRFRKHLNDAGLKENGGFMIGGLDCNFQTYEGEVHAGWQFHHHALIDGPMRLTFENLRSRPVYALAEHVPQPCLIKKVTSVEGALTYLVKSFWLNWASKRDGAPASMVRDGSRLAPEQMLESLNWLHDQRFSDLVFTYNFTLPAYAKKEGW